MRQLTYVHCWFAGDHESAKMWKEYGHAGDAVCIRTTVRRLRQALLKVPHFAINVCGVIYSPEEYPVCELISFLAACRKRPEFRHECEVRTIGMLGDKAWPAEITEEGNTTADHMLVPLDLERLFERVYVGPTIPETIFSELEKTANKAADSRVIQRSKFSQEDLDSENL
jgi:hypothetical protein